MFDIVDDLPSTWKFLTSFIVIYLNFPPFSSHRQTAWTWRENSEQLTYTDAAARICRGGGWPANNLLSLSRRKVMRFFSLAVVNEIPIFKGASLSDYYLFPRPIFDQPHAPETCEMLRCDRNIKKFENKFNVDIFQWQQYIFAHLILKSRALMLFINNNNYKKRLLKDYYKRENVSRV